MAEATGRQGTEAEWFTDPEGLFGEGYFETQAVLLTRERTWLETRFLTRHAGIQPGDRVLDVPCGHGRHAVELARRGIEVTGVDVSEAALGRADAAAQKAGVDIRLCREDTRELSLEPRFDWAITMFNSLGYGGEDQDREILRRIAASLKPGGGFILEAANLSHVARVHEEQGCREGDVYVLEYAYRGTWGQLVRHLHVWDPETRRVQVHALWHNLNGVWQEASSELRSYSLEETAELLAGAGLELVETWGDFDGSAYESDQSDRLITRAIRA